MDAEMKSSLAAKGWKFGDAGEFLGLSSEERAITNARIALSCEPVDDHESPGIPQSEV